MSCERWKEALVSRLYDEQGPHESEDLSRHLKSCEACRRDLAELGEARKRLGEAEPVIPATPRVVVLAPRASMPRWLGFAAGFACAAVLAAAGLVVGSQLTPHSPEPSADVAAGPAAPVPLAARPVAYEDIQALKRRIDEQDQRLQALGATPPPQALLTRQEFEGGLARLQSDFERREANWMQFVLEEILGVEARNSARIGETQEALRYVALASDPRVSAH